jgi:tetratricopeptide (TPR) repeat protein
MDFNKIRSLVFSVFFIIATSSVFSEAVTDAIALIEKLEYKKSIEILDRLIKKNPSDALAYSYRAYSYMMIGDFSKAVADYKKMDSLFSTIDSMSGIQWALLADGKYDESIDVGNKILKKYPDNYNAKLRIAGALTQKLEYKKSIEVLDELISKYPAYAIAYTNRAYNYMMLEDYDKALIDYKKSDQLSSSQDNQLGIQWALLALGKNDESIAAGNKVLETSPDNYYAKLRIADAYLAKKDYAKASELYKKMQSQYGKNGDLLWKIGLCEYYTGNTGEAVKLFQEGSKLAPEHKGIQYSLGQGANVNYPYVTITPEFSSFDFKGSDYIGSGQKGGISASYSPNADWNIRASVIHDKTQNLNPTKGVENYLVDPVNLTYLSQYGYLGSAASIARYYLNQPLNLYNLYNLVHVQDYITNKIGVGLSYKISDKSAIHFTPQILQSNSSLLNGGAAGQIAYSYTDKYTLTFAAAAISAVNSKGGQGSVSLYYPFLNSFYSSTTLSGQYMSYKVSETVYLSYSPILTTTDSILRQKGYAFFQQELGYTSGYFYLGAGGRYGTARTPFMGENWIYTGFDLLYGGYGQVGFKTESLTFQIQYSQDKWSDARNDRPTSHTYKIMLTWRL